jgi:hypothetical protein
MPDQCCGAARHCGHSCTAQHFVGSNVGVRDEAATLHFEKNFRYQIMGTFKFGSARKQSAY